MHKSPFASLSILHTRKFFFSGNGVAKKIFKIYNDRSTQKRQENLFSADKTAVQKSRFAFSGMLGGKGSASKHVSNHFWRMLGSGADDLTYYFSQIGHQAVRDGLKAIPGIIKSTIPSVTKSFMKISCY